MAKFPVTEKNLRELSPERDFPEKTPVQQRYAILSSPRSGSTLLGRMLTETKMAGDPLEYFNPRLVLLERKRINNPSLNLNAFIQQMEARRTSPNGVFGIKMHYSQLLSAFQVKSPNQTVAGFLRNRMNKIIWIRRRDRIGQAISQAIGLRTQMWSSEDSRFGKEIELNIHPFECIKALNGICQEDAGWEQLLNAIQLPVHEVWYEDLVNEYETQSRLVLNYLGLDDVVGTIPEPPIQRQAGELNDRLRLELMAYLGQKEVLQ